MGLFDLHVMVDWSGAGTPRRGHDSIWIAVAEGRSVTLTNPPTRRAAEEALAALLDEADRAGKRALIGFDFPLGYPRGLSQAIREGGDWRDVWALIGETVTEGPANETNRFHAAAALNSLFPGKGPFWGNGLSEDIPGLPRKKPAGWGETLPENLRPSDRMAKGAQEIWKLSGAGSVGSQALTGIAMLTRLRARRPLAIWPFEGHGQGHVAAEVFPSLLPVEAAEGQVRDAAQVETLARAFVRADELGQLADMLRQPLTEEERTCSGAILGLAHVDCLQSAGRTARMRPYEKDPAAIYAQSFATVRAEARLDRFPIGLQPLVVRLIHACGMVDVADRLAFSPDAADAGAAALARGAPVLCDCEMVGAGIIRSRLPAGNDIVVTLNAPQVPTLAAEIGNTRSAAAVRLWRDRLEGAVVAIGNAPTALFHLLELLDSGWPRPAVILGFPVGFVGAAESKAELAANPRGIPFVTLRGRRGGSAMASAAVNALAAGLPGERG